MKLSQFNQKLEIRTSGTVYKDQMFLFGGHDGCRQLNDFYVFNFTTEEWSVVDFHTGSIPTARDSHVLITSANSIYIFGGSTGHAVDDFYEYKIGIVMIHE